MSPATQLTRLPTGPHMNEILEAFAWVALVSYAFNVLVSFASGRPMAEWINPGRGYLVGLSLALLTAGYGLVTRAKWKQQTSYGDILHRLLSEERAVPEVVVGIGLIIFALAVLLLYAWCRWYLPRDPRSFSSNPTDLLKEYTRALRHYVRWPGGLDYGAVLEVRGGVLVPIAQSSSPKDIVRGLARIPRGGTAKPTAPHAELAEAQTLAWIAVANQLLRKWGEFNASLLGAGQGKCIAAGFDLTFGAVFLRVIEEPLADGRQAPPQEGAPAQQQFEGGLFLFAASLNQHEVNTLNAGAHYTLLARAIRHIRDGIVAR